MKLEPKWIIGGAIATAAGLWAFLRKPKSASASSAVGPSGATTPAGGCGDFAGDPKAMQAAINAALKATDAPGKPGPVVVDGRPGAMTCRAAEWLVAQKKAPADVAAFARSKACGCGLKRAPCGITGPEASEAVKKKLLDAIEAKGYPRSDGNKAIRRESNWHPSAVACAGADKHPVAGGLMQFIGVALKSVGFAGSPDQFAGLTGEEQLPYLLKFVGKMPPSTLHLPGDFGLALFTPAFVGKPDDFVIYEVGSLGWEQNPGLRIPGGGPITAGSVRKTAR